MHICYVSSFCDPDVFDRSSSTGKGLNQAIQKFNRLIVSGLVANEANVHAVSSPDVLVSKQDRKHISEFQGVSFSYISDCGKGKFRLLIKACSAFGKVVKEPKGTVVVMDILKISSGVGALLAAKLRKFPVVGIVTDLPEYQQAAESRFMLKVNQWLLRKQSGYVFLTEQMNDAVNPKKKPYVVVEGFVDTDMVSKEHKPFAQGNKKVIYAGSLHKKYGISDLCHAFISCGFDDAELHIFGDGDYTSELKRLTEKHGNIIFHGNCLNHEVVEAELEATLLVNPRPAEGEYTKYSFPSKTLEYMVSGTPVLTARLEGIPSEYESYLYFFDDGKAGMEKEMKMILSQSSEQIANMGRKSRRFVLKEKNNIKQAERILGLIREIKNEKN